jgi:hypothetical protein
LNSRTRRPRELANSGQQDALLDLAHERGRHLARRREGAHPAGVRAGVAVEDPLVVLRGGEEAHALAVAQRDHARLGALEPLLDDDRRARPTVHAVDEHGA